MTDSGEPTGQYLADSMDDGSVRIYDAENENAWIRSDMAIEIKWRT